MSSSPAEPGPAAGAFALACRAFAAGDLAETARRLDAADAELAALARSGGDPAAARREHAGLLAAAHAELERLRIELVRVRAGRRALRSYAPRRTPRDGRSA